MPITDHIPAKKQFVKIITCDPKTRRIEGQLKDLAIIQIALWEIPSGFRWPKEDEVWAVHNVNGYWHLGSPVELESDFPVEELEPGDTKIGGGPGTNVYVEGVLKDTTDRTYIAINTDGGINGQVPVLVDGVWTLGTDAALAAHKTSGDHDGRYYTKTETNTLLAPTSWFNATYENGWFNQLGNPDASYSKQTGIVFLRGVLNGTGATARTAFTLPAGYRPSTLLGFPMNYFGIGGYVAGYIEVQTNGQVVIYDNAASPEIASNVTSVPLNHIRFRAA